MRKRVKEIIDWWNFRNGFFQVDLNAGHLLKSAVRSLAQSKFGGAVIGALVHILWWFPPHLTHLRSRWEYDCTCRIGNIITLRWATSFLCGYHTHTHTYWDRNDIIIYARLFAYIIIQYNNNTILCIQNTTRGTAAGRFLRTNYRGWRFVRRVIVSIRLCPSCRVIIIDSALVPT